jgi:hypothetical protein
MLQKGGKFLDFVLFGSDEYIGAIRDLYFDDWQWVVRYVVVELTEPEPSPNVLISPLPFVKVDTARKEITVDLQIEKIRKSPEIDTDLPISRQYEIALRRYYEWPEYWGQNDFLDSHDVSKTGDEDTLPMDEVGKPTPGRTDDPDEGFITDTSMEFVPDEPDDEETIEEEFGRSEEDVTYSSELRSFKEIKNYYIQTTNASHSTIEDFIVDDSDWSIKYLIINLRNSNNNEFVLITPQLLQQIDYGATKVFSSISQEQLENAPRFNPDKPISIDFEKEVYNYYDGI